MLSKWKWLLCCLLFSFSLSAKQIHVAFLGPSGTDNPFWSSMIAPLSTVAEQLDVHITFHHADFADRFDYYLQAQKLLSSANKPDYLISAFRGANAKPLLDLIEQFQVPTITISSGVPAFEKASIGAPQQKYKYWLAQVLADDESSGFMQAQLLVEKFKGSVSQEEQGQALQRYRMVALGGGLVLETSHQKDAGLRRAVLEYGELDLLQLVHADYNVETASRMTELLFNRYQNIDLIWTANDDTAIAAYEKCAQLLPASDFPLIAGIDWTKSGLLAVEEGKLAFTLGGNHMQAVWALILLHDIAHGYTDTGLENNTYRIQFSVADERNIKDVKEYILNNGWQHANFLQFSKVYNAKIKRYQFDLNVLIATR
ncbi:ABC transporter substrate-binding protein [Thalassotalea atypica]|uniref:ABC transporter substrate-binding protein n=1 Tax=Thalassotalea atypica TaxID=2054316 RepID=UPI0025732626|nr:ABC transporter substrate-binding protein [Thalassotalea atypica]